MHALEPSRAADASMTRWHFSCAVPDPQMYFNSPGMGVDRSWRDVVDLCSAHQNDNDSRVSLSTLKRL